MTHDQSRAGPFRRPGIVLAVLVAFAALVMGCGAAVRLEAEERAVPDGPFEADDPAVGRLDPDLLAALQAAGRDARDDGVVLELTSGWRSRSHQRRLYREAVVRYGSEGEARRYVATPDASAHVTGDAVDIGPTDGALWVGEHGADYGLCQVFANEIWHFELATEPGGDCPALLPDGSGRP